MTTEKTLLDLHKSVASIETNVRLMAQYQKETNESIRRNVEDIEDEIDDLKASKNKAVGAGMAAGSIGGFIGFIVSWLMK